MKQALDEKTKFNIRVRLYPLVKLILEDGYRDIGTSTRLIFKDKATTIKEIYGQISEFAMHNVVPINLVQEYLLSLIDVSKEERPQYNKEYNELQNAIITNNSHNIRE